MKQLIPSAWGLVALAAVVLLGGAQLAAAQTIRSAVGPTAADISGAVTDFRTDLGGGFVAGAAGSFGGIRREINWDAVPDNFSAPNNLPADFFNVNSPRGVVFATPGTGFQVSADAVNPTSTPIQFGNLDPSYPSDFEDFSPERLFTALGSNITDADFFVAGTTEPGLTRGFGAIFTDVDIANSTGLEFFGEGGNSLGTFFAPAIGGDETFSFLGVSFTQPVVSRVRITSGNVAPGPGVLDQNGNPNDVVVMDDFIFGEPTSAVAAVPEPASMGLLGAGLLPFGLGLLRRRRKSEREGVTT